MLKANFGVAKPVEVSEKKEDAREEFRKRALESISGSMVFVEDALVWWDIEDE